jgi:hypothetical protein
MAANDNGAALDETRLGIDAYLQYTFTTGGTYYLGVSNANNSQYNALTGQGDSAGGINSIGSYTLTVAEISTDELKPGLSVNPTTIRENGGITTATFTRSGGVTRQPLIASLPSYNFSAASVPATVTIPGTLANASSVINGVGDKPKEGWSVTRRTDDEQVRLAILTGLPAGAIQQARLWDEDTDWVNWELNELLDNLTAHL